MIKIDKVDFNETVRYLGNSQVNNNPSFETLFSQCEKELLQNINVKYLYKEISLKDCDLLLGNDIKNHLKGCQKAVIMCATLGATTDNLIRKYQITDMAKAVLINAMAAVLIEDVMTKLDNIIAEENKGYNLTLRFSPGYGDYPINLHDDYLRILDAQRKIGLCVSDSFLLTPVKSVTAIIGLSKEEIERKRTGCATCKLAQNCEFRKAGSRCDN